MQTYTVLLLDQFKQDVRYFKKSGMGQAINKINTFLEELQVHPKTGTGHPEQLKGHPNRWSRRITDKHRLIYEIQDEQVVVLVVSAYGHYGDK